jgi:hypothetical protein
VLAVPDVSTFFSRAAPTSEPTISLEFEFDGDLGNLGPVAPPVVTSRPPYTPHDASTPEPVEVPMVIENLQHTFKLPPATPKPVELPVVIENQTSTLPPATPGPDPREGVQFEGFGGNIAEAAPSPGRVDGVFFEGTNNIIGVHDVGIAVNPPPSAPSASSGVQLEGMDNIIRVPDVAPFQWEPVSPAIGLRTGRRSIHYPCLYV